MLSIRNILRASRPHLRSTKSHLRLLSTEGFHPTGSNRHQLGLRDESPEVLLEMLEGDRDILNNNEGYIRSMDILNGIALCSGLQEAKVGDLVQINKTTGDNEDNIHGLGVVLTLEEYSVRVGILKGSVKTGDHAIMKNISNNNFNSDNIDNLSNCQMNPLGLFSSNNDNDNTSHQDSIENFISKASCHWKSWPNKIFERTSTREVIEHEDQLGTIFTGIPALDALCPLWRGGSMIISGPQKNSTQLATKIANNFMDLSNDNMQNRRVIYVNMSHSQTSLKQLGRELGIHDDNNGEKRRITLIGSPTDDISHNNSSAMFARTISPYLAIEIGEHAAKHCDEDVLVIIDEVGGLTHDIINAQDALLKTPQHTTSMMAQPIKSKVALSSSARTISASLLDRASIRVQKEDNDLKRSGSLSIIGLLNIHPNYDALTGGNKELDSQFEIIKESFNGYCDSHLTLSYNDIFARIRSRHPMGKGGMISLDWEMVNDMNKTPPMFNSKLTQSNQYHFKLQNVNETMTKNDIQEITDVNEMIDYGFSRNKSQEICLAVLSICLKRLLKETSLIQFAAETAKQLGIEIEDENEKGFDLIECSNRAQQLLSSSSIIVPPPAPATPTVNFSMFDDVSSSTSNDELPSLSKYRKKINDKLKLDSKGDKELKISHFNEEQVKSSEALKVDSMKKTKEEEEVSGDVSSIQNCNDKETAMAVSLCSLCMMRPDTVVNDDTWKVVAHKFRTYPELLVLTEAEILNVFRRLTSDPSFAPKMASQLIARVLDAYVEK